MSFVSAPSLGRGEHQTQRPSEYGFGPLFWAVRDAVVVGDATTGKIVLWNPAAQALFGYAESEALGLLLETLVPPEFVERHRAGLASFAASGHGSLIDNGVPVVLPALHKNGERIAVELTLSPLDSGSGGDRLVLALIRDVTERIRVERAIQEGAAHLEAIIDVQNEIATATQLDVNAVMQLVAERAQALTNASGAVVELLEGDEMVYRAGSGTIAAHIGLRLNVAGSLSGLCIQMGTLLHCTDTETDPRVDLAACRRVGARSMLVVPLLHDGQTTGVLKVMAPSPNAFTDRDARTLQLLAGLIGAAMSRAAQAEAERALAAEREATMTALLESRAAAVEASRLKSDFLSTMSHELRTPMNAIIGYSHLLLDGLDGELTEQQAADIGQIARSADQLLALINDLLDLSKIEAGRMDLFPEPIDLAGLALDVRESVAAQAAAKRLTVDVTAEPGVHTVQADPMRVRQILLNLAANAVKFTERGGVRIAIRSHAEWVDVDVIDTGIGISAEALGFIFDEFRQADGSTTRRFGGTGLGLAISRKLARLHGGDIDLISQTGVGSTFTLRLPKSAAIVHPEGG